jgi:hypothetical protein
MTAHPHWTIETARRHGFLRRRPKQLMAPQDRPQDVGQWLTEYLDQHPSDHAFRRLRVLEHPLEGIAPIEIERPRGFIDYARDPLAGLTYVPDLHEPSTAELYDCVAP